MGLNFAATLINCVGFSVRCTPIQGIWDHNIGAKCITDNQVQLGFTIASIMSVVVDFMAVIIPVFAIRNLQMPLNTKISISIIMGLGLCTASISIGKVFAVRSIRDQTWDAIPVQVLSSFEENLAIIVVSVPALRQLYISISKSLVARRANRTVSATRSNPTTNPSSYLSKSKVGCNASSENDYIEHKTSTTKIPVNDPCKSGMTSMPSSYNQHERPTQMFREKSSKRNAMFIETAEVRSFNADLEAGESCTRDERPIVTGLGIANGYRTKGQTALGSQ